MVGILSSSLSKFQNPFPSLDLKLPELLVEVRDGSNSDEQLLSIRASSTESEGTVVFVLSRASSQCLLFIDLTDGSSPIDVFLVGSGEGFFSGEPVLHCCAHLVLCFLRIPSLLSPPSLSLITRILNFYDVSMVS
jgi:hypothetical protein